MNGSLINAFEYFIAMYEHNPEIKLHCLNLSEAGVDYWISIMENRYNLSDLEGYRKNIINIQLKDLIRLQFDNLLVVDFVTIATTLGLIRAKNLVVISEKTDDPKCFYRKDLYNVTYYGEMPYLYKDHQYRMKLLFHRFKPLRYVKEAIYINAPLANIFRLRVLEKPSVAALNLPDKPLLYKTGAHLENLFENFDTYVYYHANRWFDPHPRLFVECTFYGKEVYYVNDYGIKDGSYYRYKDICENGVKDRDLSKDDEIVRQFI